MAMMEYVQILNLSTKRSPRSNNSAVEWLSSPVPETGGSRGFGPEYRYTVITLGTSLWRLETGKGQNQFGPAEVNKSKIRSEETIQSPKIQAKRGETHRSRGTLWKIHTDMIRMKGSPQVLYRRTGRWARTRFRVGQNLPGGNKTWGTEKTQDQ